MEDKNKTVIPDPNNQAYYDIQNAMNDANKPIDTTAASNPEGYSNTGSGIAAAMGQDYSWDVKGKEKAANQFSQDVLAAKQEALTNRQTIEQNAGQYQKQVDLKKYSDNQSAQSAGWTGGQVLDQNRQMEYLKQSIQAQMYGAMELQKYGYDTALAAARLSYDMNQQEFAHQYYQDAINNALTESNVTGVYFSPEVKDMLSQMSIAEQKLKENPDDAEAKQVQTKIKEWFSENKISEAGIKSATLILEERSLAIQQATELWTQYTAALESAKSDLGTTEFIKLDSNGNPIYSNGVVQTGDWNTMTAKDKLDYINSNPVAKETYKGYIETLGYKMLAGFKTFVGDKQPSQALWNSWIKSNSDLIVQELKDISDENLKKEIIESIECSDIINGRTITYKLQSTTASDSDGVTGILGNLATNSGMTGANSGIANEDIPVNWVNASTTQKNHAINASYGENFVDTNKKISVTELLEDTSLVGQGSSKEDGQNTYTLALMKALENGEVPNGALISFNYGDIDSKGNWWDSLWNTDKNSKYYTHTYMYIDGELYACSDEITKYNPLILSNVWTPEGYTITPKDSENYKKVIEDVDTQIKKAAEDYIKSLNEEDQKKLVEEITGTMDSNQLKEMGLTDEQINQLMSSGGTDSTKWLATTSIAASVIAAGAFTAASVGTAAATGLATATGIAAGVGATNAWNPVGWVALGIAAVAAAAGGIWAACNKGKGETFNITQGTREDDYKYKGYLSASLSANLKGKGE